MCIDSEALRPVCIDSEALRPVCYIWVSYDKFMNFHWPENSLKCSWSIHGKLFITRDGKNLSMGLLVSRDINECLHFTNFSFFGFILDDLNFGAKIRARSAAANSNSS